MQMLVTWIRDPATATGNELSWNIRRVLFPGTPYEIDNALIRLEPLAQAAPHPGSYPQGISLLRWLDRRDPSFPRTQRISEGFCAVLSHVSGARIELADEIPLRLEGAETTTFAPFGGAPDPSLYGPAPDDLKARFDDAISLLASLENGDLAVIGAAMELHYASALLFEKHLSSAYLLLVSALEILSRRYGQPPTDFEKWDQHEGWSRVFGQVDLSEVQRTLIIDELMKDKQLRLGQTFVEYGSSRVPESFWDEEIIDWTFPIHAQQGRHLVREPERRYTIADVLPKDRSMLKRALSRTYAARSGYVHAGRRGIDFVADISAAAREPGDDKPLPFKVLRHLVREIVHIELTEHGRPIQLPDIRLTS